MRYVISLGVLAMTMGLSTPAVALDNRLQWPLACSVGHDCFITRYPDLTRGSQPENPQDYRCGSRTYPGETGTHVIFKDWRSALSGIEVFALAEGEVREVNISFKDGEPINPTQAPQQQDCGNFILVAHPGLEAKYCHLNDKTLTVSPGQKVRQGEVLGQLGQTADTPPHFVFYLTQNGQPFDPFSGQALSQPVPCSTKAEVVGWSGLVAYPEAAVVASGFAPRIPSAIEVAANTDDVAKGLGRQNMLVAWTRIQGIQAGDKEEFSLTSPEGKPVLRTRELPGAADDYLSFVAMPKLQNGLTPGLWQARYQLWRGGRIILQKNFSTHLP